MIKINFLKITVFSASLSPLAWLTYRALTLSLGPDPQLEVVHFTGTWAMYLLLITLAVTPAYKMLNWRWSPSLRRMLGLFSLFYALLHITAYSIFIVGLDLSLLVSETLERPYIALGAIAFVLLCLLGATSTKGMMRRMGRRWKTLHRSIYWLTPLVLWHYHWSLKLNKSEVYPYIILLLILFVLRSPPLIAFWKKFRQKTGQFTN